MIFYRCQPPYNANCNFIMMDTIFFAKVLSIVKFVLGKALQVKSQGYHGDFIWFTNTVNRREFFFLNFTDSNNCCALFCEVTFNGLKKICFEWRKISVKNMSVEGVHDHRYFATQSGKPANRTRFAGMCVYNVRFKILNNFITIIGISINIA